MKRPSIWLAAVLVLSGCEPGDQRAEALGAAEKRMKVGAYQDAVGSYESALDGTAKTADVHYKIAVLYDGKLKNPLDAIHHYDRYLDLAPDGPHAKDAKKARAECEKRLQARLEKDGFMSTSEAVKLRNENERLRADLTRMRNPPVPTPPRVADPAKSDPMPPGSQRYTVVSGDTLGKIAIKFYKSQRMADQIKDANFNQLGGKDEIRPGQILIIPEAPSKKRR